MKHYLMEFVGTFFLVLAVTSESPLAIGAVLAALVYVGWYISGANYNPAVTTAVCMNTRMDQRDFLWYICAQILGALAAVSFNYCITGQRFPLEPATAEVWLIFIFEAVLAFFFCLVVLSAMELLKKKSVQEYGLVIGAAYLGVIFLQGIANPAIAAGAMIFAIFKVGTASGMVTPMFGYLFGPFVGAWLAARAHKYLNK